MEFTATISESDLRSFENGVVRDFEDYRSSIEQMMAARFLEIVRMNFGVTGVDRPSEWSPVTKQYAKKVRRDYATLFVTGALQAAVKMESTADGSRVYVSDEDVPYATAKQYGSSRGLPPRPYFPLDAAGKVTPWSETEVIEAANNELARLLAFN